MSVVLTFPDLTVVTLPAPAVASNPSRGPETLEARERTVEGVLRVRRTSFNWIYRMGFRGAERSVYDALVNAWADAALSGTFPTMLATDHFQTADNVQVALEIGDDTLIPFNPTLCHFNITVTEVYPR